MPSQALSICDPFSCFILPTSQSAKAVSDRVIFQLEFCSMLWEEIEPATALFPGRQDMPSTLPVLKLI